MLSVLALIPLGIDLDALKRLTGILDVSETNLRLNDLLHRTGDRAFLVCLARRLDSVSGSRRTVYRLILLRISNWVNEWSYESYRESGGSNSGAATASYAVKTLHFHEKSFLKKN